MLIHRHCILFGFNTVIFRRVYVWVASSHSIPTHIFKHTPVLCTSSQDAKNAAISAAVAQRLLSGEIATSCTFFQKNKCIIHCYSLTLLVIVSMRTMLTNFEYENKNRFFSFCHHRDHRLCRRRRAAIDQCNSNSWKWNKYGIYFVTHLFFFKSPSSYLHAFYLGFLCVWAIFFPINASHHSYRKM